MKSHSVRFGTVPAPAPHARKDLKISSHRPPAWLQHLQLDTRPRLSHLNTTDEPHKRSEVVQEWVDATAELPPLPPANTLPSPPASVLTLSTTSSQYANENSIFTSRPSPSIPLPPLDPLPLYPPTQEMSVHSSLASPRYIHRQATPRNNHARFSSLCNPTSVDRSPLQDLSHRFRTPSPTPIWRTPSSVDRLTLFEAQRPNRSHIPYPPPPDHTVFQDDHRLNHVQQPAAFTGFTSKPPTFVSMHSQPDFQQTHRSGSFAQPVQRDGDECNPMLNNLWARQF